MPQTPWPAARREAAQIVWGEGFIGPHDEPYILSLVNILRLNPEMTILDLGAGLGGPTRVLAEKQHLWVTGREISAELASAGMELAHKAGLALKAPIERIDPAAPDLPTKKHDVVLAFDAFYRIEDKAQFFDAIGASLKPTAQVIFTDLVAGEKANGGNAVKRWTDLDPEPVHLWTVGDYSEALKKQGLSIGLTPLDLTGSYCDRVISGWWKAQQRLREIKARGDGDVALLAALVREVEMWACRTEALQSGELAVYRIYGDRK